MATTTHSTGLSVRPREAEGSRAARRLRRAGEVPGVIYGGSEPALAFAVEARALRTALHHAGAVLEVSVGDGGSAPAVVKELARHPVSGEIVHVDLLRVDLDVKIETDVVLDLIGVEDAPGVKAGGVLEQVMREVAIEALPGDIPDSVPYDASALEAGATVTLADLTPPAGTVFTGDPETIVATITAPRLQLEDDNEIEQETEVIGEAPPEAAEGDETAPPAAEGGE